MFTKGIIKIGKIWKSEANGYVYSEGGICPTLLCGAHSGVAPKISIDMAKKYRIRKLTPTECFALMGVRERERERLTHCGVSESQQYKMAGNSIVVDVLMGIFGQMFNPQPKEDRDRITFPWW